MNSVRSNNLSLKYQRFIPSGCKDIANRKFEFVAKNIKGLKNIGFRKSEFVTKTQFLSI